MARGPNTPIESLRLILIPFYSMLAAAHQVHAKNSGVLHVPRMLHLQQSMAMMLVNIIHTKRNSEQTTQTNV